MWYVGGGGDVDDAGTAVPRATKTATVLVHTKGIAQQRVGR